MSSSRSGALAPLTLTELTELVHATFSGSAGARIVSVDVGSADVALGTWPVPSEVAAAGDCLVGFLAPPEWAAVGLVAGGQRRTLEPTSLEPPSSLRCTVLFDRDGNARSVLHEPDSPPELVTDAPEGWVADLLRRALALPTPPPGSSLGEFLERTWLDRVAALVLARPGQIRHWRAVARRHPLAPPGKALPGVLLGLNVRALEAESSWTRMRLLWSASSGGRHRGPQVPGGVPIALADWFDDGSFSRWVARNLPETDLVLPAVLDALPADVGAELLEALTSVEAP